MYSTWLCIKLIDIRINRLLKYSELAILAIDKTYTRSLLAQRDKIYVNCESSKLISSVRERP